jgi:hypothetical protein
VRQNTLAAVKTLKNVKKKGATKTFFFRFALINIFKGDFKG